MQLFIIAHARSLLPRLLSVYFGCSQIGSDGRIRSLAASSHHRDLVEGAVTVTLQLGPSAVARKKCQKQTKKTNQTNPRDAYRGAALWRLNETSCSDTRAHKNRTDWGSLWTFRARVPSPPFLTAESCQNKAFNLSRWYSLFCALSFFFLSVRMFFLMRDQSLAAHRASGPFMTSSSGWHQAKISRERASVWIRRPVAPSSGRSPRVASSWIYFAARSAEKTSINCSKNVFLQSLSLLFLILITPFLLLLLFLLTIIKKNGGTLLD